MTISFIWRFMPSTKRQTHEKGKSLSRPHGVRPRAIFAALLLFLTAVLSSCTEVVDNVDTTPVLDPWDGAEKANALDSITDVDVEMRGVFIASVYNIDFPSKKGLSSKELAAELDDIVETAASFGINTIFFQVRPSSDALYDSKIFPISEYLTGGESSSLPDGFDPLDYIIKAAHKAGLRVHAWVNPLRVTRGSEANPKTDPEALAPTNPARLNPKLCVAYADGSLYYDPGLPEVRALIAAGVREIAANYDVDGIIFDDYFYPYPVKDANGNIIDFDDAETYAEYSSGFDNIADWRRNNINLMIKSCYEAIKDESEDCLFGVAPFGIWQNSDGSNGGSATSGFDAYSLIYCDALAWVKGGYVDYIAPQIYWSFDKESAPFDVLADWWNAALDGTSVKLYISLAAYKYGTDEWSGAGEREEITSQINYARKLLTYKGCILYGYSNLKKDIDGVATETKAVFSDLIYYTSPVSTGKQMELYAEPPVISEQAETATVTAYGISDPAHTVDYLGENDPTGAGISRKKDGSFTLTLQLHRGENIIEFRTAYGKYVYAINVGT